ncbi:LPS export ABC transporter periplasmic protein LptC [Desulfatitalea alkaliphila]|uniref:LPS export ABC transporter periplasmic protein LptC n=1 Tax=Desulfatitalea alkaliphila TaxID=2929485 RepID=A0AA41RBN8_9BACT|nr:LPS export ABC transporter periplasmic protein LptC [Desulfatitalea alkaliphila]MCJ8502178.1 LPS export ABC transporter periplasmic protein LptC [Desulfatitalea alkaliphila]
MADRRNLFKWILTVTAILAVAILIAVFFQFRRQQDQYVVPLPDTATRALMRLAQLQQTATKDGRVQWELDAAAAELETGSQRMILTAPEVVFHTEEGDTVHLTAERGVLNTRTNDMEASGNVRVRDDRYTLETEKLIYRHEERLLESDVPVYIHGGAIRLRADTMVYDLNTNQAHFDGHVEGFLYETLAIP